MTCNMQQEGVGLVLLPRPASLVHSPVLPCVEAPLGESVVLLADAGGENPTGAAGAHVLGGGERGWGGDWTCMKKEPWRCAYRDSNPRSMAWETSVFPICYFPMWLYTCIHNHQV